MDYIVMDLEWNQSGTGKEPEVKVLPFEIIEIGAIKLNSDLKMVGEFNELIKPVVYRQMHQITSKLIHMQMEELERGKSFEEIGKRFLDWCGSDYVFCTWGPLDLTELQRNIDFFGLPALSDGPIRFLDVQKLFAIAYEDKKSRKSLEYAIDYLYIEKDIPFHRAFSDAYYTAKVLAAILDRDRETEQFFSYDTYKPPKNKKEEIKVVFDNYEKYISRCFSNKRDAFADREVSSTKCYICHKNLKKKIKWFSPNGKHFYALSICDEHGFMKSKIRIHKTPENRIYVVKTNKFISEEDAAVIEEKFRHHVEQRNPRMKKAKQ